MIQTILNYLKDNSKFTLILGITLVVCIVIITFICIFFKKSKSNISNEVSDISKNEPVLEENFQTEDHKSANPSNCDEDLTIQCDDKPDCDNLPDEESCEEICENDLPLNEEKEEPQEDKQTNEKYAGKWLICEEDTRFFAKLVASNGEIMLRTETYSSLSGVKSGIITVKNNVDANNYAISVDKNGKFFFKIFSTAKRLLCIGETYTTREQCEKAFASVKRFSKTAKIVVENKE